MFLCIYLHARVCLSLCYSHLLLYFVSVRVFLESLSIFCSVPMLIYARITLKIWAVRNGITETQIVYYRWKKLASGAR